MEPALALGDRLDGHMVQGHVDCVGVIESFNKKRKWLRYGGEYSTKATYICDSQRKHYHRWGEFNSQ